MIQPKKIFSTQQIKAADRFTIKQEPIASINLMEQAAAKCAEWLQTHFTKHNTFIIFCGNGNNGGDGLAIARILFLNGFDVRVYTINASVKHTDDFLENEKRLNEIRCPVAALDDGKSIPEIKVTDVVIDAIFGTGISKPITGIAAEIITAINASGAQIISVDIPSGLVADSVSDHSSVIIKANHTLSCQFPKLAFFFAENASYVGNWEILDIGLSEKFIAEEITSTYLITHELVKSILKPRPTFSHKGTYGHALLVAGSYGKIGAAVLSAGACLRSGVGLLTVHLPACGYEIMQIANPEAMVSADSNEKIIGDEIIAEKISAIGIGPGIGTEAITQSALHYLLTHTEQPLVIDADALNILSQHKDWLEHVPANSILTPHPKEFERLAGKAGDDFERHQQQLAFSGKYKVYVVLKGAYTCITTPGGESYFNTTGNPGMAKGGSGDVLTGVLASLLAQGYSSLETCLLGVYIHGLAGDLASASLGETGMIAGDIVKFLPAAFK
jgi:NAD(P)H-hydrate epimerase